jgi:hypothetical protein
MSSTSSSGSSSHRDDFREPKKRIGISVCEDERERTIADAALVNEMNTDAIDRRAKLREPVHGLLLAAPVERTRPVLDDRAQLATIGSERPSVVDLVRPPSPPQSILEIVQRVLRHIDAESVDAHEVI